MAEHRVTDLVYGHLGQFSYDTDEEQWSFSKELSRTRNYEQLLPFKQCIPPSIREISTNGPGAVVNSAYTRRKWLAKKGPEITPAIPIATKLAKIPSNATPSRSNLGALLAVGGAVDPERSTWTSTIVAVPCGEAGHVLKFIKPRVEKHGWGFSHDVRLSMMDAEVSEQGHWAGTGGTILQITSAEDEDKLGTWFAIRQATITTIFRPVYQKSPKPFTSPASFSTRYPPSCLDPNPVARLTPERAGSENHVDVTFNPWYSRQFAVVDQSGRWSSWDIEGRQTRRFGMEIVPAKAGHIYDDLALVPDSSLSKLPGDVGEWHRLLWAGSLSTMVVLNRRHLAVFDTKLKPIRLPSPVFADALANDWIIDVKRSTVNLGHIFVLTTTRLFWINIIPAGEDGPSGSSGANILLSQRHFRDNTDETMKLVLSKDDEDLTLFIYSSKNPLITSYTFFMDGKIAKSFQGSLKISENIPFQVETCSILPASYITPLNLSGGVGLNYMQAGVRFYQIWMLTVNLELVSTLWASENALTQELPRSKQSLSPSAASYSLVAPTTKTYSRSIRTRAGRLRDDFIVPDVTEDDSLLELTMPPIPNFHLSLISNNKSPHDLHLRIDMRPVFDYVLGEGDSELPKDCDMGSALRGVSVELQNGKQVDSLPMRTCLELSNMASIVGDLDEAAIIIDGFMDYIKEENDEESSLKLHLSKLTACPGVSFSDNELFQDLCPDLLKMYDLLIDAWVTNLPRKTPGLVRLVKSREIRKIAMELWMSSVGISLRNISYEPSLPRIVEQVTTSRTAKDLDEISRASSPPFFSSQLASHTAENPQMSLPTPTPSVYSHASSTTAETEDPAMSRLRQYAVKLTLDPELGPAKTSLLSQWPSLPGTDPATFSWEEAQKAAAAKASSDDDKISRKEQSRRRRRSEKFLMRERANSAASSSQPAQPFGSQPISHNIYSSQPLDELPMTQPDRGTFGRRVNTITATPGKKKKRRAAGF